MRRTLAVVFSLALTLTFLGTACSKTPPIPVPKLPQASQKKSRTKRHTATQPQKTNAPRKTADARAGN